eukprot:COSAG06_NODE_31151_length_526_cov_0.918033_2_plen_129_part_01
MLAVLVLLCVGCSEAASTREDDVCVALRLQKERSFVREGRRSFVQDLPLIHRGKIIAIRSCSSRAVPLKSLMALKYEANDVAADVSCGRVAFALACERPCPTSRPARPRGHRIRASRKPRGASRSRSGS